MENIQLMRLGTFGQAIEGRDSFAATLGSSEEVVAASDSGSSHDPFNFVVIRFKEVRFHITFKRRPKI